jgi:hypothetical protein
MGGYEIYIKYTENEFRLIFVNYQGIIQSKTKLILFTPNKEILNILMINR